MRLEKKNIPKLKLVERGDGKTSKLDTHAREPERSIGAAIWREGRERERSALFGVDALSIIVTGQGP